MLKNRIIPTLLWKDLGLVKGKKFDSWRRIGSVMPAIKIYNSRDVDELILLDITATLEQREPDEESIKSFASECFVPFCVGGGINRISQIEYLLKSGADKVAINTFSYENPNFIKEASINFGSQCIVASIDVRKINEKEYYCFSNSGKKNTYKNPVEWSKKMEDMGCGEILLTAIDRDGTLGGYDLELIKFISESVNVPVIASGGAKDYNDMVRAIKNAGASAVAASSMFHFTEQTPNEAKNFMFSQGINVRDSLKSKI
jgi:cyclase